MQPLLMKPVENERLKLLAAQLAQSQQGDYSPVRTPMEGIARALGQVVGAYSTKKQYDTLDAKQTERSKAVAGELSKITQSGAKGSEAIAALLASQNPDVQEYAGQLQMQQMQNQLGLGDTPANIQEWNLYNQMAPEDQKRYLDMKRNPQFLNLGDRFTNPSSGTTLPKGIPPEQQPNFQAEQERAKTIGKGQGAAEMEQDKKALQATGVVDMLDEAEKLLPEATGSGIGAMVQKGKQFIGSSDEATQTNKRLELLSGWLVANVPRMEGPQSNFDVLNYKAMAADIGNPAIPVEDRMAALKQLRELQGKYTGQAQSPAPQGDVIDFNSLPE